jgi:hypothetical protein
MATPPLNQFPININAPLNFRHTDTLITTKVPHYPTKVTTGVSIIPGWNRPNANGQNANIIDKDYNGPDFKARPLKHWRRQLRVYNYNGGANNSRTANISQLERPGLTVYKFTPDCTCVAGEGGNSYIISNNQFGYETKDDNYSKGVIDVQINNNGYIVVPYNATEAQINDPTNPAYKVLTGIYNTNCINCSPQGNIIKSGVAFQSQAFYSYSNDKLESRCQTYEQNISTNKATGCNYFDAQGIPLWPNDTPNGPQVVAPVNYGSTVYKGDYADSLYCLSQTIYKPNNIGFGRQGAVSGSTRLKKLVSDTVCMNGSSFYSAKGAADANIGKYQGTNISSNYYLKIKPGIDSCIGTIPSKPKLETDSIGLNDITVDYLVSNNGGCPVLYYTLTYYPTLNVNNITSVTIPATSSDIFKVTGLTDNTYYNMYITATNGNGESPRSDILATNTLLDPNIQITVGSYTYTYSPTPIIVTVTITSLNTFAPITASIIDISDTNVADLTFMSSTITNITTNVYSLTLSNGGTFHIQATQPLVSNKYGASIKSQLFTIQRATPVVTFPVFFDTNEVYGSTYILVQATITSPSPSPPGVSITEYTSSNRSVATISGTSVTILKPGQFQVIANTNQTQNYNSTSTPSPIVTITKSQPIITFTGFITSVTWGSTYTFVTPTVSESPLPASPPLPTPSYTIANTSVATISGTTVTLVYPGTFSINATTAETDYYFSSTATSPNVSVVNIPEIIIYNNPKVFPRDGGISGEVGLIIGIPSGSWPVGFSQFTNVTITRVGNVTTIPLSPSSSPTYNNSLNKYLVYGEPSTAGPFITTLNTSTASNIALVQQSAIANGASLGVTMQFAFSGGSGSGVPSTFTGSYTTVGGAISQGLILSNYSSITASTVAPPPSGSSQKSSLLVGWKGFGGPANPSNTSSIQEAWGVTANSTTAPVFSPLIQSGSPPNHIFYPQLLTSVMSGSNYYLYTGIPKMIAPNY